MSGITPFGPTVALAKTMLIMKNSNDRERALVDSWPGFPDIASTVYTELAETNRYGHCASAYFSHRLQSDNLAYSS